MTKSIDLQNASDVRELFRNFENESISEWFDAPADLIRHYQHAEHVAGLKRGEFGKLNGKYIFVALTQYKKKFEDYLVNCMMHFPELRAHERELMAVLEYNSASIIDLPALLDGGDIAAVKIKLPYDVVSWKEGSYLEPLAGFERESYYVFEMEEQDRNVLEKLLVQYHHVNKNVTLRKMSEYMPLRKLFMSQKSMGLKSMGQGQLISIQTERAGVGQS